MIIAIPNENSIIKWKNNDKDEWKAAEISDLIKAYERPQGESTYVSDIPDDKVKDLQVLAIDYGEGIAVFRRSQKGKWKHIIEEDNDVECPFCGFQEDGVYYNFCPGCGADMRGEE